MTCVIEGCDGKLLARGLCQKHYSAQWKASRPACRIPGCEKPSISRDMCSTHYARWLKHGDPYVRLQGGHPPLDLTQRKTCEQCGEEFSPTPRRSHDQWAAQRFCPGRSCANAWKAQRQSPGLARQQQWATSWERRRRIEDNAELRTWKPKVWPQCWLKDQPKTRTFIAGYCAACRKPWTYYAKRAQSPYCATCAAQRRKRPGKWRAQQAGALCEPIIPAQVFERDQWRCQICGRKTRGTVPMRRAATLDHIVPLSQGGSHTYENLQCACFRCNCLIKGAGAMNDQLRLVG